ncbi:MAG: hypothetical protein KGI79_03665 [Patescibacteria group bacterium]|nr:hypothetical protein [Patescibacteria group bacterium]MDE2116946.1 hypothetical protein [Patescibacteria group bacterium]
MTDRRRVKRMMGAWIALGAAAIVLGYGTFRAKNLVEGPRIAINSPISGEAATSSIIEIRGTAENISFLTLDDGQIFTDSSGRFDEKVLLSSGYNVVTLKARDRFGRIVEKTLQLTYN